MTAPARTATAGLILAGGQSRRMGRDKTVMELAGRPLYRIAADLLKPLTDRVFVCGESESQDETAPHTRLPDNPAGLGPIGGIATGLEQSGYEHHLVLAVDYPLVRPDLLLLLLEKSADYQAVCGRSAEFLEPLVAYYHAACAPVMRAQIAGGEIRTHRVFAHLNAYVLSQTEYDSVDPDRLSQININTPEDLETAKRILKTENQC